MMQTAWYFTHFGMGLKTRLFHLRPGQFTESGRPEQIYEEVEQSPIPQSLVIRERLTESPREKAPASGTTGEAFLLTPSIEPVYERARRVADTDHVTALIMGESGTGKEHLARYIHDQSARGDKPVVAINCSALSADLLESRLFGYREGSFTGATEDRPGVFEEAEGGTVFLDEIGDSSPALQQALLRVIQERVIVRVGETKARDVDVRVIAATHRDLAAQCAEGAFRWDLYYRLAVAELELPPLRERGTQEVEALVDHFLEQKCRAFRRSKQLQLDQEARRELIRYGYPGNVRELEHLIERLYVFCDGEATVSDLPECVLEPQPTHSLRLADVERVHIERVYRRFDGNKTQTADALGCALNTLKKKLRDYEIV